MSLTTEPAAAAPATLGLPPRVQAIAGAFVCPACRPAAEVRLIPSNAGTLDCRACRARYPVRNGVPILLTEQSVQAHVPDLQSGTGQAMVQEYGHAGAPGAAAGRTARLGRRLRPPPLMLHHDPHLRSERVRVLFDHAGPGTRILNVGGGPTRYSAHEVTMNLDAFHNVDTVGDAHTMPFATDTFDSIICNAVLEHVHSPERVAAEMMRVLRPGGLLYAEVPFIFFFHGYPNDFTRLTQEGMRRLFSGLDGLELGITNGPVSAMLQSFNTLLQIVLPPNRPRLLKAVRGVYGWLVFPLKYLDKPLSRRPDAHLLAGGFYALGRKPGAPA